jgi:hypothetical protein
VATIARVHQAISLAASSSVGPNPYESMRFLIDRGIDMTIKDYRWNSTAQGWALDGKNAPKLAEWLEQAERQQELRR